MSKEKYLKMINVPIREEMLEKIKKVCEEKDIPVSVFMRDAIKLILNKVETENGIGK
jgi:antitoxin component of RelBE/YafQ-DinJ toxin-antitoxin module